MNRAYDNGFDGWFSTLAALASPVHTTVTRRPLYERVAPLGLRPGLRRQWRQVMETLALWRERVRYRQALHDLDDRLLRDIGLTRAEVEEEWDKPFWRP
jgi:uncharacterized protein YjiS (DUF1127 family)